MNTDALISATQEVAFAQLLEVDHRVHAGARWLDTALPGWRDHVDLEALSMASTCNCVLGQVAEFAGATRLDIEDALSGFGWFVVTGSSVPAKLSLTIHGSGMLGFDSMIDIDPDVESKLSDAGWLDLDLVMDEFHVLDKAWKAILAEGQGAPS